MLLGIAAAAQGGLPALVAALPALPWGLLCLKALCDLGFNSLTLTLTLTPTLTLNPNPKP